ncbi:MAG: dihydrolipoyl dehydrogenase family protein [Pseudomonadales bacterium]
MTDHKYDIIVIGTGAAASVVAFGCRKAGRSVAVIDHRPFGGTCALRGCDPKKVLIAAAEIVDGFERLGGSIGAIRGDLHIDWPALQRFKRSFTNPVPAQREQGYADGGIDCYHGRARFIGPDSIGIGDAVLQAKQIVVATGAEPVPLPIEGFEHLISSDDFLEMETLPRRIVLVGGGYIGFEFAHIAARAGAEVTILNRGTQPLREFEPDLVELLIERTRALGVRVNVGHEAKVVRKSDTGFEVEAVGPNGRVNFETDVAIHSGGRKPALAALDLEAANLAHHAGKLTLDKHLRSTSNPSIYAAGDAAGGPFPLTPVAALQARAIVDSLLGDGGATVDYTGIPSAVFTLPPLARAGLLEHEARAQGLSLSIKQGIVPDWYTARRINESCYGYKVMVDENTGLIVGAHLLGPDAAEVINVFAMAIRNGLTVEAIRQTTFAYPTAASDIASMLP